ncbi:MAG: asparagine synthase (glutamine-hydrolyzing) [Litoreibacter sp.]
MCGICGWAGFQFDSGVLETMIASLYHRGPDDSGTFDVGQDDDAIAIGHTRLSIVDAEGGLQPKISADGRFAIAYNGEVYNFMEVSSQLKKLGAKLETNSDTEVALEAWSMWGIDALPRLRGTYSMAIVDLKEKKLNLIRDHSGKKPLYYAKSGSGVVFASEIGALQCHPDVTDSIDPNAAYSFLKYRYTPSPNTFFEGIKKVQPGTVMTWDAGEISVQRFSLTAINAHRGQKCSEVNFLRTLQDAVTVRVKTEVPFGVFLSSGIDSAAILALALQAAECKVPAYTIGFKEDHSSEIKAAEATALSLGADHHSVVFELDDLIDNIDHLSRLRGAPLADPADIPMYLLAGAAAKDVKIVLSGEGADELLGGYPKYFVERFMYNHVANLVAPVAGLFLKATKTVRGYSKQTEIAMRALSEPDPKERLPFWFGKVSSNELQALWTQAVPETPISFQFESIPVGMTPLRRAMFFDQQSWMADNLLERLDSMTMAASIEARAPFLDERLASLTTQIADRNLIRGFSNKLCLRRAMQGLLPSEVIERRKRGFALPLRHWFKGRLGDVLMDELNQPHAKCTEFLNKAVVEQMLHALRRNDSRFEVVLWSIFALEKFLRAVPLERIPESHQK